MILQSNSQNSVETKWSVGVFSLCFLTFSNLFVALNNILVLLQSLEQVGERSLHGVQVTGHLLLLQQGLIELLLGLLSLPLLISCIRLNRNINKLL